MWKAWPTTETVFEADQVLKPETVHRGDAIRPEGGTGYSVSMLEELNTIVESAGLPVETGVFSTTAPDEYIVITPISEHFELFTLHHDDFR